MSKVGVRELSERTSEIVRRVREDNESVELTYRGEVVARIVPASPERSDISFEERWERRRKLAEEAAKYWPEGLAAADAIADNRR